MSRRTAIGGTAEAPTTVEGLVVRTESGFHRVQVGEEILVCRAAKRLLYGERTATTAVVIGDRVRVRRNRDGTGLIEEMLPRSNELIRGAAGGRHFLDVIAANLDLLVVVHSLREPDFDYARLDRFLVLAEAAEIPSMVCLNKLDLEDPARTGEIAAEYRNIGYPVVATCATTGRGVQELRAHLDQKTSALVGPSGAGKSSLLNDIQPGLRLRTAEVSEGTGRGRHTTTTAALLPLDGGGYVADTPGLGELDVREVSPPEVEWLFPEFRPLIGLCRFSNCTHRAELGCAVTAAVGTGGIHPERYASYRRIYDHVVDQQPW